MPSHLLQREITIAIHKKKIVEAVGSMYRCVGPPDTTYLTYCLAITTSGLGLGLYRASIEFVCEGYESRRVETYVKIILVDLKSRYELGVGIYGLYNARCDELWFNIAGCCKSIKTRTHMRTNTTSPQ